MHRASVGTSTNLGGWINKAGIWSIGDRMNWFADDTDTVVRWRESGQGRHIELGIVQQFGQSGDLAELYEHRQIDAESVVGAALDLLD